MARVRTRQERVDNRVCPAGLAIRAGLEEAVGADRVRRVMGADARLRLVGDVLEVVVPDRITAELTDRCLGEALHRAGAAHFASRAASSKLTGRGATTTPTGRDGSSAALAFRGVRVVMSETGSRSSGSSGGSRRGGMHRNPGGSQSRTAGRPQGDTRACSPDRGRAPSLSHGRHGVRGDAEIEGRLLDRFVVGESNRLAHAASVRMASGEMPGGSVLFLHGGYGVGKTHLLRGIFGGVQRNRGRGRYVTAEAFTSAFVGAVRDGGMAGFKRRFRSIDVLCIDDVHLLVGKSKTQQELVQTLDVLQAFGSRVVLASDAPPTEIGAIEGSLMSRFAAGVTLRIGAPDEVLIGKLIRSRARECGLAMTEGAVEAAVRVCVARGVSSVRDIVGAVMQIDACARLEGTQRGADATTVSRALWLREKGAPERRPVSMGAIIGAVCVTLGVDEREVFGTARTRRAVLARELCVHVGRELTGAGYPEIAAALRRRNRSTAATQAKSFGRRLVANQQVSVGSRVDGLELSAVTERVISTARAAGIT